MKPIIALGAIALLSACQMAPTVQRVPTYTTPAPVPTPPPVIEPSQPATIAPRVEPEIAVPASSTDGCGADSLQAFVGSVAPQPFPAPGPVRVYAEGDPITMDHNPSRVNVVVDRENRQRVVSISCG